MSTFLIGFLSALLAATPPVTAPSTSAKPDGAASARSNPIDLVEKEYEKLLEDDDAAQQEADKWIREADAFRAKGVPTSMEALNERIEKRFAPIRKGYEDFLQRHPSHIEARLAYGSFLYETLDEDQGVVQWEKARDLDPKNPAAWNNLANHFGHRGPIKTAFEYYAKAIELNPEEPVYLQNLATTVYLFRRDAMEQFHLTESQVFDRALELYQKALRLDPKNFPLATDYAQSYYGIKPLRTNDALNAWNYALKIANDGFEREGVYVHMARVEINSGQFDEARKHLNLVTNTFYNLLKERLTRNLVEKEHKGTATPDHLGSAKPDKDDAVPAEQFSPAKIEFSRRPPNPPRKP